MSDDLPRIDKPRRIVISEESLDEPASPTVAARSAADGVQPMKVAPERAAAPPVQVMPAAAQLPALDPSGKPPGSRSFCRACGNSIDPRAMMCPACGVAAGGAVSATAAMAALSMQHKSPGMAILLSIFLPGAGQFYVGRTGRGIAFFCAAVFSYVLIVVLLGLILVPIVVIWAAVDANKLANAHNAQLLAGVPLT